MEPEAITIAITADGSAVSFSREERERHVYIVGKSGSGKSTLLFNLAMGDISRGEGVAVIDPHGDLALDILDAIPRSRINDVCYLDVTDTERPVGFNPATRIVPERRALAAAGIGKYGKNISLGLLLTIVIGNLIGWGIYLKDPSQQREDWRAAVAFVESRAKVDEMAAFSFTEPFAPYQWYSKGAVSAKGLTDSILANPEATRTRILTETSGVKGVYYFEYLWELHDPQRVVEGTLRTDGFNEVAAFDFPGVGIIRYLRRL